MTVTDRNEFYARYVALDGLIDRFTAVLPPIDRSANADAAMTCLVTHTLARAATIQLRSSFKEYDRLNDRKDLAAAHTAAALLENTPMAISVRAMLLCPGPTLPNRCARPSSCGKIPNVSNEQVRAEKRTCGGCSLQGARLLEGRP